MPRSLRARLTLWYTVMLGLPLVAFAIGSHAIFSRTLWRSTDAFVGDALTAFANELAVERRLFSRPVDAIRTTVSEVRFRDLDILVLDAAGAVIAATPPRRDAGEDPRTALGDSSVIVTAVTGRDASERSAFTVRGPGGAYRLLTRPVTLGDAPIVLVGAYPLIEVERTLATIRRLFFIAIPLLIVVASTGGWFLARRSLRPVAAMAARAGEIGATTLHERLPAGDDDELGALAGVLNDLLDRLERSFDQQRRFMADASHELRTPTAIIRTEADVTLSREHRTEGDYRESMAVVQDGVRRLARIVDDIFLLARADAGHLVMQRSPLDPVDLVRDAVRAVRPIAERRSVQVALEGIAGDQVLGDADLLGRLVLNLLDNAIKHSPEGGTVAVGMADRGAELEISVVNAGPGIPVEAQHRVFERFFRADPARSRAENSVTSGAGLGLAIGQRIAEMHGGSLVLRASRDGHTEFRIALPRDRGLGLQAGPPAF